MLTSNNPKVLRGCAAAASNLWSRYYCDTSSALDQGNCGSDSNDDSEDSQSWIGSKLDENSQKAEPNFEKQSGEKKVRNDFDEHVSLFLFFVCLFAVFGVLFFSFLCLPFSPIKQIGIVNCCFNSSLSAEKLRKEWRIQRHLMRRPGVFKGRRNWGTLRIPFGKIGEP